MAKPTVAVVFGSDSDWPVMEECVEQLTALGVSPHVEIMSAHRNPRRVQEFAAGAEQAGLEVIIAAAGMSAALAGTIAAHTALPVIGVPLASGSLGGIDALLSTVQMPPGVPVASVGIGSAGATNAALLAIRILSRHDEKCAAAYEAFRADQARTIEAQNRNLSERMG